MAVHGTVVVIIGFIDRRRRAARHRGRVTARVIDRALAQDRAAPRGEPDRRVRPGHRAADIARGGLRVVVALVPRAVVVHRAQDARRGVAHRARVGLARVVRRAAALRVGVARRVAVREAVAVAVHREAVAVHPGVAATRVRVQARDLHRAAVGDRAVEVTDRGGTAIVSLGAMARRPWRSLPDPPCV